VTQQLQQIVSVGKSMRYAIPLIQFYFTQITDNHEILLDHMSQSTALSSNLSTVRSSLTQLDASLNKLQSKIHTPCVTLRAEVSRLEKSRMASELLRRAGRFLVLARRLETQMGFVTKPAAPTTTTSNGQSQTGSPNSSSRMALGRRPNDEPGSPKADGEGQGEREREMLKAALTIAELGQCWVSINGDFRSDPIIADSLLGTAAGNSVSKTEPETLPTDIPLNSLDIVAQQAPVIARSRETVIAEMENMVVQGLANLVCRGLDNQDLSSLPPCRPRTNHYCRPHCKQRIT
jgi:hypothetical protein